MTDAELLAVERHVAGGECECGLCSIFIEELLAEVKRLRSRPISDYVGSYIDKND